MLERYHAAMVTPHGAALFHTKHRSGRTWHDESLRALVSPLAACGFGRRTSSHRSAGLKCTKRQLTQQEVWHAGWILHAPVHYRMEQAKKKKAEEA